MLIPLALMALPSFAAAQSYSDKAAFEILPGWRTAAGDHISAIKITLAPGWITYWRAPGEAGIPPQFSFASNSGITSITPHWPVPDVFEEAGLKSIGYYDSVIFPLIVAADGVTGDIPISGHLTVGVCEEICIPVTYTFDTVLPQTGAQDAAITAALADDPLTRSEAKVGDVICKIDPISDGLRMTTQIDVAASGASEFVVVEPSDPRIWVSQADVIRDGATLRATVEMVHPSGQPFAFDRSGVRITVLANDGHAIDLQGCSAG
ncbi:DsbC/DsbD-like thiol-disulfide interchange protein [Yoonia maricola]|uniref:DsbC/DsbD-like thiol-disulfide interchange protein n=2 Tax=Yoonia maricola TaxID=420999 RepID=A0A2M8WQ10_9RHOB|nr:DsbC/DsbD-like thiol-disulfide interchange protein [Yoonia maricola]